MSGWAFVAIVAIVVWGIVQLSRSRRRADHGPSEREPGHTSTEDRTDPEAQREIEELRERIAVLERIATDGNSLDAKETQRIAAEIEALRGKRAE